MWQVYEIKNGMQYLEFQEKKIYLNFLCYIYLNLWIKAKDLQRVLLRNLLPALNLRNAQDVDEAPVSERSEQNTKFSASEDRDRDRKKMATNAFFQRINRRNTQVANPQQLWNVTQHLLPEFSILGERVFLLNGLILLLGSQSRLSFLVTTQVWLPGSEFKKHFL